MIKRLFSIIFILLIWSASASAAVWYVNYGNGSSTGHYAVAQWAANHTYAAGSIVRQLAAPAVGSERCFYTAAGGTSHSTTEPTWVLTAGAAQPTDGTITDWVECTGNSARGWNAPHARLPNTMAAGWGGLSAGDTVYISNNSAETQSSAMTLQGPGTAAAPIYVICVNDGAAPPTATATTATVSTTGASNITFDNFAYYYGITFSAGSSSNGAYLNICLTSSKSAWHKFDSCKLTVNNSSASSGVAFGNANSNTDRIVTLVNTPIKFGATGQKIAIAGGIFRWFNTTNAVDSAGTIPTSLFATAGSQTASLIDLMGLDFSALTTGKNIVSVLASSMIMNLKNCRLNANTTVLSTTIPSQGSCRVFLDNCDSADPASGPRMEEYYYQGSVKTNLATYLTAGATDGNHHYSLNFTSLSGASYYSPMECRAIPVWNSTTGSTKTITLEILHDSLTNLTDGDIWIEVQEFATASLPISSVVYSKKGILANAVDLSAGVGSDSWTISPSMTNPNSQKLTVTTDSITEKGYFLVKVFLAKPTYTVYVDPKITVQ